MKAAWLGFAAIAASATLVAQQAPAPIAKALADPPAPINRVTMPVANPPRCSPFRG